MLQGMILDYMGDECKHASVHCASKKYAPKQVNYLKDHDLDLRTVERENMRYLVQIRYPLECLPSYYTY